MARSLWAPLGGLDWVLFALAVGLVVGAPLAAWGMTPDSWFAGTRDQRWALVLAVLGAALGILGVILTLWAGWRGERSTILGGRASFIQATEDLMRSRMRLKENPRILEETTWNAIAVCRRAKFWWHAADDGQRREFLLDFQRLVEFAIDSIRRPGNRGFRQLNHLLLACAEFMDLPGVDSHGGRGIVNAFATVLEVGPEPLSVYVHTRRQAIEKIHAQDKYDADFDAALFRKNLTNHSATAPVHESPPRPIPAPPVHRLHATYDQRRQALITLQVLLGITGTAYFLEFWPDADPFLRLLGASLLFVLLAAYVGSATRFWIRFRGRQDKVATGVLFVGGLSAIALHQLIESNHPTWYVILVVVVFFTALSWLLTLRRGHNTPALVGRKPPTEPEDEKTGFDALEARLSRMESLLVDEAASSRAFAWLRLELEHRRHAGNLALPTAVALALAATTNVAPWLYVAFLSFAVLFGIMGLALHYTSLVSEKAALMDPPSFIWFVAGRESGAQIVPEWLDLMSTRYRTVRRARILEELYGVAFQGGKVIVWTLLVATALLTYFLVVRAR